MSDPDRLINRTAEAALLGGMLMHGYLIEQLSDTVSPEQFADPLHGRIFSAMQRFAAKGKSATPLTLRPVFAADSDCRYGEYLDDLVEAPVVPEAAQAIADQVAELAARRKCRAAMRDAMTSLVEDLDRPIDAITGDVEQAGWAASRGTEVDPVYSAGDLGDLLIERDDMIVNNPNAIGISCDLVNDITKALGPLGRGTYNIIAARPGMGKTALANSISMGFSMLGHRGIFSQHEMKAEQMALRTYADMLYHLKFDLLHQRLVQGSLNQMERAAVRKTQEHLRLLPLNYVTPGTCDIRKVWSIVARQKALCEAAGQRLDFVVVDYIQKLNATHPDGRPIERSYERVNAISTMLKRLAEEMDVTLIALAQLSRGVEQRPNKRPILSDLKESGNLEQDADTVTMLYREEYYLEQEKPKGGGKELEEWEGEYMASRNKLDLIVVKNRHGKTGTRTCRFIPERSACRSGDFDMFNQDMDTLL